MNHRVSCSSHRILPSKGIFSLRAEKVSNLLGGTMTRRKEEYNYSQIFTFTLLIKERMRQKKRNLGGKTSTYLFTCPLNIPVIDGMGIGF